MLNVAELTASYGMHKALSSVSLHVEKKEIAVILGANGAGKSTLLKVIAGICEGECSGDVMLDGQSLNGLGAEQIVEAGIAFVPEGRGIFGDLSVQENLLLGAYTDHARDRQVENLDRVLTLFPKLAERKKQIARTMSGGEQQMVAIGRALMSAPSVLMLDEPSLGLSPLLCKELFSSLIHVRETGVGILLVEQNAKQSLAIADRGYLLENGRIVGQDSASQLLHDPAVQAAYLGGAVTKQPASDLVGTGIDRQSCVHQKPQATSSQAFTPRTNNRPAPTADALIGDDINALVARASSVATVATANKKRRVSAALTGTSGPPVTNLLSETSANLAGASTSHPVSAFPETASSREIPVTQDAKVQQLLADFETAALAASRGSESRGSESRGYKSSGSKFRGSVSMSSSENTVHRATDDLDNLPPIPVYRKSPVTVYRRDTSGTLRKQKHQ